MDITILYGTETGNAEMLAEDISTDLSSEHDVVVSNLENFDPANFDGNHLYLIVCSTYGDGELPASAQPFAQAIEKTRPDLSTVLFGIFGLGDSSYTETYNFGSKQVCDILVGAGARQIGERLTHDASGTDMSDDLALPWARRVVSLTKTVVDA
ncbi:flavodoxin domain-containing protein [Ochrobactrum sp. GPK 3]|uniref:flavodoxin domain-containing protein n=1 Tax=Brucella sp. 22210 TaxID=3453892 RepID=UPI0031385400